MKQKKIIYDYIVIIICILSIGLLFIMTGLNNKQNLSDKDLNNNSKTLVKSHHFTVLIKKNSSSINKDPGLASKYSDFKISTGENSSHIYLSNKTAKASAWNIDGNKIGIIDLELLPGSYYGNGLTKSSSEFNLKADPPKIIILAKTDSNVFSSANIVQVKGESVNLYHEKSGNEILKGRNHYSSLILLDKEEYNAGRSLDNSTKNESNIFYLSSLMQYNNLLNNMVDFINPTGVYQDANCFSDSYTNKVSISSNQNGIYKIYQKGNFNTISLYQN